MGPDQVSSFGLAPRRAAEFCCAVCGELIDAEASFCSACGSPERIALQFDGPASMQSRLLSRIAQALATEATLHSERGARMTSRGHAVQNRTSYARLASQRKLLRDRLMQVQSAEEREVYRDVLDRIELVLLQHAATPDALERAPA